MKHKIQLFPTALKVQTNLQKRVIHLVRVRKIFPKLTFLTPLIHTRTCAYQGVKKC